MTQQFTLTPSLMDSMGKCPQQAYYAHIEKIKMPPGIALVTGTAYHEIILERDHAERIRTGSYLPISQVVEELSDKIRNSIEGIELQGEDLERYGTRDKAYTAEQKMAGAMLDLYNTNRDVLRPTVVELPFEVEFADTVLAGRFDSVVSPKTSEDLKTKDISKPRARKPREENLIESAQFQSYAAARAKMTGDPNQTVRAVYFEKHPTAPAIEPFDLKFGEESHNAIEERAYRVHKIIQAGAFLPVDKSSQNGWICDTKWCGYYEDICPFGKKARVQA
jgi:hypothetical protein